jgi:hypothetical protein
MAHVLPGRFPVRKHPGLEHLNRVLVRCGIIEHGSDIPNIDFEYIKHFHDQYQRDYSGAVGQ